MDWPLWKNLELICHIECIKKWLYTPNILSLVSTLHWKCLNMVQSEVRSFFSVSLNLCVCLCEIKEREETWGSVSEESICRFTSYECLYVCVFQFHGTRWGERVCGPQLFFCSLPWEVRGWEERLLTIHPSTPTTPSPFATGILHG